MKKSGLLLLFSLTLPLGCAADHAAAIRSADARSTVGDVQREIRVGMSGAEVARALGSPNIVTTDEERRETWVYDKISTETVHSSSASGINLLVLGVGARGGASSTSQRTLTVIIKFDKNGTVRDFAYHASRF